MTQRSFGVKINAPDVLTRDLERFKRKGAVKVYMSPITDPLMPILFNVSSIQDEGTLSVII